MKSLTFLESFLHSITGWNFFKYPNTPKLPNKPLHPDGDLKFTSLPKYKHPNSDAYINHLHSTGRLKIGTGDTKPGSDGRVGGYPLNVATAKDKQYEISMSPGPGKIWVSTHYSAPYGEKVRLNREMIAEGYPMKAYADSKLHIFDPVDNTITEIQYAEYYGNETYRCHGIHKYSLDLPSTDENVKGRSAAKWPLAESTQRYDEIVLNGHVQMATMAVVAANKDEFVSPAIGTDGKSTAPQAPPMGVVLRLKNEAVQRLIAAGAGPQAQAVMKCYSGPGIMIVDSGGNNSTSLEPDNRWDQKDLSILKQIQTKDFEVWTR